MPPQKKLLPLSPRTISGPKRVTWRESAAAIRKQANNSASGLSEIAGHVLSRPGPWRGPFCASNENLTQTQHHEANFGPLGSEMEGHHGQPKGKSESPSRIKKGLPRKSTFPFRKCNRKSPTNPRRMFPLARASVLDQGNNRQLLRLACTEERGEVPGIAKRIYDRRGAVPVRRVIRGRN